MANRTGTEQGIGAVPRRYFDVAGDESWYAEGVAAILLGSDGATLADADQGAADGVAGTKKGLWANARGYVWNGATWDRAYGNTNGQFAQGSVASGSVDAGNPVKVGGVVGTAAPAGGSTGQRKDLWVGANGHTMIGADSAGRVDGRPDPANIHGADGTPRPLGVAPGLYNGLTWDRERGQNIIKTVAAVAITAGSGATIWTPNSGKKFRLLGWSLSVTVGASLIFGDNAVGTVILRTELLAAAGISQQAPAFANGFVSAAANNVLKLDVTTNATVSGYVFGTEE